MRAAGPDALLDGAPEAAEVAIADVVHDSRDAGPGVLFACRPGERADGHDFAPAATAAGSPALLVERLLPLTVPQIQVESVAAALGAVAATVHHAPSTEMHLCGVTGTNGKTTTAYFLEAILRAAGHVTGLIGTVETRVAGERLAGVRTTPEATDLQRLLRGMVDGGVTAAAMEVSSHGLALGRVTGTRYAVAAFTNLTQDHLDFHHDLEQYFMVKAELFSAAFTRRAVVNIDDAYGRRLASMLKGKPEIELMTYSAWGRPPADVRATDVTSTPEGSVFSAVVAGRQLAARTRLAGSFNVGNALCALASAAAIGIELEIAAEGIAELAGVPGRMERIDCGQPFTVLVDYAHTPDSLASVLRAASELAAGKVIVVVGCGGDRDVDKRPLMGEVAARRAGKAVLTSDNPRREDPLAILDAVARGAARAGGDWMVEPDRRSAIEIALNAAVAGDVVVIAGKGHETYQELATETVAFDDRAVARAALAAGASR